MSKQKREKFTATAIPEKNCQQKPFVRVEEVLMFKQKREKFTASATQEKLCQQKPFVQVEGELTEAQLEAIAAGAIGLN